MDLIQDTSMSFIQGQEAGEPWETPIKLPRRSGLWQQELETGLNAHPAGRAMNPDGEGIGIATGLRAVLSPVSSLPHPSQRALLI